MKKHEKKPEVQRENMQGPVLIWQRPAAPQQNTEGDMMSIL